MSDNVNSQQGELEIQISSASGYSSTEGVALAKANKAFESLGEALEQSIRPLRDRLRAVAPDELELSLSLCLKSEAKWVVISAGGEATVSVKLVWKKAAEK